MKLFAAIVMMGFLFASCSKDKFKTEPQISYKSIKPNVFLSNNLDQNSGPILTIHVTDLEGNLGEGDSDTASYVYVRNITIPNALLDSFKFPDLTSARRQNLDVDVEVFLRDVLQTSGQPNPPYTDTLFFEVYVTDNAKNKSNVLTTPDPVYYVTP